MKLGVPSLDFTALK